MIEITVDRIRPLIPPERILVVTAAHLVDAIRRLLPDVPRENIIGEPVGKDTAPCIALAGKIVEKRWGEDTVLFVKGADYRIGKPERFRNIISEGAKFAAEGGRIVTLGLRPSRPDTGYGYIERGEKAVVEKNAVSIYPVRSFREKPDEETAKEYCATGRFYWNSGMSLWTAATVRKNIEAHAPGIASGLEGIEESIAEQQLESALERVYPELPKVSIDYAVMEKAENVYVTPADIEWDDVGSWLALERHRGKDAAGNVVTVPHIAIDTKDCVITGEGGLVATLGVENLLIVRAGDVVLVADKSRDQEIKRLVSMCREDPELHEFL
jgi:mannose-1-phosphate guanylyltransferase